MISDIADVITTYLSPPVPPPDNVLEDVLDDITKELEPLLEPFLDRWDLSLNDLTPHYDNLVSKIKKCIKTK